MESLVLYELQLYAPVEIAGQNRWAHLDTGATQDTTFGVFDGVEAGEQEVTIRGALAEARHRKGRVSDVRFLGDSLGSLEVVVSDDQEFYANMPFPVSMRLGRATLLSRPLLLDFKALRVGREPLPEHYPRTTVPLELFRGIMLVDVELEGQKLRTAVDIGAAMSVVNTARLPQWRTQPEQVYEGELTNATDTSASVSVCLTRGLTLGGLSLRDCEQFMVDLSRAEAGLGTRIDMVLGLNTLLASSTVWYVNPEAGKVEITTRGLPV